MNKKVFVVGGSHGLEDWFHKNGFDTTCHPFEADLFQFMGGADVTPAIYGEENTHSYNDFARDLHEAGYFALAHRINKPMVGICRGGQFLNVMCGGHMLQHVEGHTRNHKITAAVDDKVFGALMELDATSTHHQMMQPTMYGQLLAWATIVHDGEKEVDPEVVYYAEEQCLCFQPHPEYGTFDGLEKYYFGLINSLYFNG